MPMTDAQRKANRKYANAHYTNPSCKIRKDRYEALKLVCYENGTTPNQMLLQAIDDYMEKNGGWEYWLKMVWDKEDPSIQR